MFFCGTSSCEKLEAFIGVWKYYCSAPISTPGCKELPPMAEKSDCKVDNSAVDVLLDAVFEMPDNSDGTECLTNLFAKLKDCKWVLRRF